MLAIFFASRMPPTWPTSKLKIAAARCSSSRAMRGLFELLGRKELPQGKDELPGVDLTGAEPGAAEIVLAPEAENRKMGGPLPPLRLGEGP